MEDFDEKDEDHDGKLTWKEYLHAHFSYSEDEIKEMRRTDRDDVLQFLVVCSVVMYFCQFICLHEFKQRTLDKTNIFISPFMTFLYCQGQIIEFR